MTYVEARGNGSVRSRQSGNRWSYGQNIDPLVLEGRVEFHGVGDGVEVGTVIECCPIDFGQGFWLEDYLDHHVLTDIAIHIHHRERPAHGEASTKAGLAESAGYVGDVHCGGALDHAAGEVVVDGPFNRYPVIG